MPTANEPRRHPARVRPAAASLALALALVLALSLLAACGLRPTPPSARAATLPASVVTPCASCTPPPQLVVYGDSLSVGANQNSAVAPFPYQVAYGLQTGGSPWPRVDGFPGFTAAQIDAQVRQWRVQTGNATTLVVEAGTNDLVMGTPLADFQAQYPQLVADALATATNTPAPRLICLGVWHREQDANNTGATGADYDAIIRQTCAARGGTYLALSGLYATPGDLSTIDNFHPSTQGQQQIAQLIQPYAK